MPPATRDRPAAADYAGSGKRLAEAQALQYAFYDGRQHKADLRWTSW